ncbi:MAG: T9SS type A sorting domain-containing protein, partial [Bacteroidetes bacterium]|nr:T9SS type A sorting domain-containing protein [Bacteroidota bacterium]
MKQLLTGIIMLLSIGLFSQPAGTLDPDFGINGKLLIGIVGQQDVANSVVIQADGKIVVAGYASSSVSGKDFFCIRLKTDGTYDSTFGLNGIVKTDLQLGSDDVAYSLSLQTDGKLILAGYSDNGSSKDAALVRYHTNGIIDSSFGSNGVVLTDFEASQQDEIHVAKIHHLTGKIIVGGTTIINSTNSKPVVARYLSNGSLDTTFNANGIRLLWITSLDYQYYFSVEDLAVQPNGKISAVGWRDFPSMQWSSDYWACRINADGSMDNTFSLDGVNVYNGSFNGNDRAYAMLLKSNNKMLIAGGGSITSIYYDFSVFEAEEDGGVGAWSAKADYGTLLDDIAYGIKEDDNGKFVMAGSTGNSASKEFAIVRINADESLDTSFDTDGKLAFKFDNNSLNECYDLAIQTDNKIVVVGYSKKDIAIARILGNDQAQLNDIKLLSPSNNDTEINYETIKFDWMDAFGATNYEFEIDSNSTFTGSQQTIAVVSSDYTMTKLDPDKTYYWRVRASDGTNWGSFSSVWSFTTNSLENFVLQMPSYNSKNQEFASLTFEWSDAFGASKYEIEIDSSQDFTINPQSYIKGNSEAVLTTLTPSTDYFWRVRASNGVIWGQWSNTWKFSTKKDPSVSIHENAHGHVSLYPNPATNYLTLEFGKDFVASSYVIIDVEGKVVSKGLLKSEIEIISLKLLKKGHYYFQLQNETTLTIP